MWTPSAGANPTQTARGERTAVHGTPSRAPDRGAAHLTTPEQAALYRAASGDLNALHIDPETAQAVGFKAPILTGTCTLGIAVRHVMEAFAGGDVSRFGSVKVRLSGPVYAALRGGVRTEMWDDGERVLFRMVVDGEGDQKERVVLSKGCVTLKGEVGAKL